MGQGKSRGKPFSKGSDPRRSTKGHSNAGRDTDWLKAECQKQIDRYDLMGFLGKVAGGENIEQVVSDEGEVLHVPAPVKDRLRALEMLLDRKYGKVPQALEHSGPGGEELVIKLMKYE